MSCHEYVPVEAPDGMVRVDARIWRAAMDALHAAVDHPGFCTGGPSAACSVAAQAIAAVTGEPLQDRHRAAWDQGFAALESFNIRHGHTLVPDGHMEEGFLLADWVTRMRVMRPVLPDDRAARLESVQRWQWGHGETMFDAGYPHMRAFALREGHCEVPSGHQEGRYPLPLRTWRETLASAGWLLDPTRRKRLLALPGWTWRRSEPWTCDEDVYRLARALNAAPAWHDGTPRAHT